MLRILTSKCMLAHAFAWSKTIQNTRKWVTFFFVCLRKPLVCLSYAWWKRYFFKLKKMILTSKRHAKHPLAGWSMNHLSILPNKSTFTLQVDAAKCQIIYSRICLFSTSKNFKSDLLFAISCYEIRKYDSSIFLEWLRWGQSFKERERGREREREREEGNRIMGQK